MHHARTITLVGLLTLGTVFAVVEPTAAAPPRLPVLNARVLAFAQRSKGVKVGNGECWTLGYEALKAARAHLPGEDGYSSDVFGKGVALDRVIPGDILQFEEIRFYRKNRDGSWYELSFPHHTAIVAAVNGKKITLLHQNVNNDKRVQSGVIDLADRQRGGTLKAYRPQAR
jgi:hypothetical protein